MTAPLPSTSPRPFAAAPDPRHYFPAVAIEETRQRVLRSIQRGEGPALVIGSAGLGKTMLLEVVAGQFRDQLHTVLLMGGQLCTRRALLQTILFQLNLPYRAMDESELRLSLLSYLQSQATHEQNTKAHRLLLLVDEADALPPRLLEELRALINLSVSGQPLVHLVLAGNATLEEQFADPKLDLFSQRVAARNYLSAFGREETFQYVRAQVAAAGNDPDALFTSDGLEAIFAATDGAPRLINQLGDQLLWMVAETGYSPLDGVIVGQAWSELQQLPAPWNMQSNEPVGSPVEYGELDSAEQDFDLPSFDSAEPAVTNFVADHDSDDFDDMPASIPIHPQTQPILKDLEQVAPSFSEDDNETTTEFLTVDLTGEETYDATSDLIAQLSTHEVPPRVAANDSASSPTKNPFAEFFESEEIVLDRYSSFESQLLAEAPRVVNSSDTAFAQQLQGLEVAVETETEASTLLVEEASTSKPASIPAVEQSPNQTQELLVIEEEASSETVVVAGQKFRQLFSNLESADSTSCFG